METIYSSCTVRSSENICSSSRGAREKGKTRWTLVYHQNWRFCEFHPPSNANVFFWRFFFNLTPNSGLWCCAFLTLQITLLYTWEHFVSPDIVWSPVWLTLQIALNWAWDRKKRTKQGAQNGDDFKEMGNQRSNNMVHRNSL